MEDNENKIEETNEETKLEDVIDLEGVNPVAKMIVLGVAGLATGGLVTRKLIKKAHEKKAQKEETEPKKPREKKKIRFQSPVAIVPKEEKKQEAAE